MPVAGLDLPIGVGLEDRYLLSRSINPEDVERVLGRILCLCRNNG